MIYKYLLTLKEELNKRHLELSKEEMLDILTKPFNPSEEAQTNLRKWRERDCLMTKHTPPPPEVLLSALQDKAHIDSLKKPRAVKLKRKINKNKD